MNGSTGERNPGSEDAIADACRVRREIAAAKLLCGVAATLILVLVVLLCSFEDGTVLYYMGGRP
ncbi:MAG: hypothetical protein ACYTAF_02255 [Planctomycetota bacterium]